MAKRQRDTRAEYERRKAKAIAEGWSGLGQKQRALKRGFTDPARYREAIGKRARRARVDVDQKVRNARRQVHQHAAGRRSVTPTKHGKGWGVIDAQLRRGVQAFVAVDVKMPDGSVRTVNLYGRGGYDGAAVADELIGAGGGKAGIARLIRRAYQGEKWADQLTADDILDVRFTLEPRRRER